MTSRLITPTLLLALAATASEPVHAQSRAQDNLRVHARVITRCAIHAEDLDFGLYSPAEGAQATTFVNVRCTPGVRALVGLDGGEAVDPENRRMSGRSTLNYQLYRDAARRDVFGERGRNQAGELETDGSWQRIPVYGHVPKGQNVEPGAYRDTVNATVIY